MLDIKFIRENKELIEMAIKKKKLDLNISALIETDEKRRSITASVEKMRAEQNEVSKKITASGVSDEEKSSMISKMKVLKESLQKEEEALQGIMKEWQMLMLKVPNIPDISVPEGESDKDNKEIRTWGDIKSFTFEPKSHVEILEKNKLADFERGTKLAGFRGYVLESDIVSLNFAIWQHALSFYTSKGFKPMMVPSLVKKELLYGSGYLPQGEDDLYKTQDEMYLSGTGEVGGMGLHSDETLVINELPIKYLVFSTCYRREAGSHGKDVKGLYRVHEFYKFEQLVLSEASHERSVELHEELTKNAEEFLQSLSLPYRVVVNCGGDLGLGQVKKYDIETWLPSKKAYGETHSSSYFHDFQTRRLNIRYRDQDGKIRFAHSLNNTAVASPRILISIIENYQLEDGKIAVPEVLKKYMGKDIIG